MVLLNHQDRVLLTRRRQDVHLPGIWEFPGGKLEPGEKPHDALIREIQEELCYTPQAELWQQIDYKYPKFSVSLYVYKQQATQPGVSPNEQQEMKWCEIKHLSEQALPPANQAIVDALIKL